MAQGLEMLFPILEPLERCALGRGAAILCDWGSQLLCLCICEKEETRGKEEPQRRQEQKLP